MPDTTKPVADPHGLMHWASAMREAGDLAPMVAVVRDEAVVASGFVDPSQWEATMGIAFYGFGASAVVGIMDTWLFTVPIADGSPGCSPREAFEAGDPRAAEALVVVWIPRAGDLVHLWRTYSAADDRITWLQLGQYEAMFGPVAPSAIRGALDHMERQYPDDVFADVPEAARDAATAKYLGLELR